MHNHLSGPHTGILSHTDIIWDMIGCYFEFVLLYMYKDNKGR